MLQGIIDTIITCNTTLVTNIQFHFKTTNFSLHLMTKHHDLNSASFTECFSLFFCERLKTAYKRKVNNNNKYNNRHMPPTTRRYRGIQTLCYKNELLEMRKTCRFDNVTIRLE